MSADTYHMSCVLLCPQGKNFDRTFSHPKCPVAPLYPKFEQLLSLSKQYDPAGMFRTRLFNSMTQQGAFELQPQCRYALLGSRLSLISTC
jgi:hypothetical protein